MIADQSHVIASRPASRAPIAAIVIVTYNARAVLPACLQSLYETCPDCEIVVVDNASSDGTAQLVRAEYPNVRLVHCTGNGGYGAGNNLGASLVSAPFLAFLNPDTVVEPGWLDALLGALEDHPQYALATAQIVQLREADRINTCGLDVHFAGLALCRRFGDDRSCDPTPQEVASVSGAAFVVRRKVFEELGGFDPGFFLYMEDVDLSWRARLAGYRCLYVPGSVVRHAYELRFGPRKTYWQERNRYLMLLKSLRWRSLLVLVPALLLTEMVTWGFVLLRERRHLLNKLKAYGWVLVHWPRMGAARRRVQSIRRCSDRDLLATCTYRLSYEQTGDGLLATLAHAVFDTLYRALFELALSVVRW